MVAVRGEAANGSLLRITVNRNGAEDWIEVRLYNKLHASLMALTSSPTGAMLRRAATVPETVINKDMEDALRISRHYTVVHVIGCIGETF